MEEIDLIELFKYQVRKWQIFFLTTLLAILIGIFFIEYIQVPMYHGTTTIALVQKNKENINDEITQTELNINEKLISTYTEIIKSRRVLKQVIKNLDLDTTIKSLSKKITVTLINDTSIIEVQVKNSDKNKAAAIANELANVFKKEIIEIYKLENVAIIDEAIIEKKPYNVDIPIQILLFALIGAFIAFIIISIMYCFDTSIKNRKEIETKLGLPVLGEIPVMSALNKKTKNKSQNPNSKKDAQQEQKELIKELKTDLPQKSKSPKKNTINQEKNKTIKKIKGEQKNERISSK